MTARDDQNPSPIHLADYRPPAWRVEHIALTFDLGIDETLVSARLHLQRERDEPLRLDGEDLELLEIALDGRALDGRDDARWYLRENAS